jgi:hypothetical protein
MGREMKWFFGILLAALASFGWGFVSWELMGWHQNRLFGFQNETEVAETLVRNARNGHGVYLLPHVASLPEELTTEEKADRLRKLGEARNEGPFVKAVIRPGKKPFNMQAALGWSFARSVLACLLLAALLSRLDWAYLGKVGLCAAAGAFAGAAGVTPEWIWFELPVGDVFVALADLFIEWTLAGLVLAAYFGQPPTAARQ